MARIQEWVSSSGRSCDLHMQRWRMTSVIHTHRVTHLLSCMVVISHSENTFHSSKIAYFKLLSLFLQSWSKSNWGMKHLWAGPALCCHQHELWDIAEAESWVQELLGQFLACCDSSCAEDDRGTGWRQGHGRAALAGWQQQGLQTSRALAGTGELSQDSHVWKDFLPTVLLAICL